MLGLLLTFVWLFVWVLVGLVVLGGLGYAAYWIVTEWVGDSTGSSDSDDEADSRGGRGNCPVCGMEVDDSGVRVERDGETYAFCRDECRVKFEESPEQYSDN